jgi:hypothetical protein
MKYRANLIKEILKEEKIQKARSLRRVLYSWTAFGILALVMLDATFKVINMRQLISFEQEKLDKIVAEYETYQKTEMTVNRMDIELLDQLQHNRVFWTKKLAATALYLPEQYWIENISFSTKYEVSGYGYMVPEQKQLMTIDSYLNFLRADTTFNDDFPISFLDAVVRADEDEKGKSVERVLFELSATKGWRN